MASDEGAGYFRQRGQMRIMRTNSHSTRGSWQRILGCLLAYALALQGCIFAFDLSRSAIAGASDAVSVGYALCSHSGAGVALPDAPAQSPVGDSRCMFCCIAGAVYVNCAPPCAPQYSRAEFTNAVWPLVAPRLVALVVNAKAWPRGPPAAA
jgi:hypothetical protein